MLEAAIRFELMHGGFMPYAVARDSRGQFVRNTRLQCTRRQQRTPAIMLAVLIALLSGCSTQETPEQRAQRIEPLLAAAGFRAHPADSPAKLQNLKAMAPLKVSFMPKDGKMHYWFADPVYCTCLYTGGPDAYAHYEQLRLQQKTVEEERETAELNESAASEEIDSGIWGFGPIY